MDSSCAWLRSTVHSLNVVTGSCICRDRVMLDAHFLLLVCLRSTKFTCCYQPMATKFHLANISYILPRWPCGDTQSLAAWTSTFLLPFYWVKPSVTTSTSQVKCAAACFLVSGGYPLSPWLQWLATVESCQHFPAEVQFLNLKVLCSSLRFEIYKVLPIWFHFGSNSCPIHWLL